ncbi:MAG TPA: hypothetical protein VLM85_22645 [Polyangiaceae bacterium]|nr:hypothetical protein [Polyangiaceae bacterium]
MLTLAKPWMAARRLSILLLTLVVALISAACDNTPASSTKELTQFSFVTSANPGLSSTVIATISGSTISATVPSGTSVNALRATFATTGASVTVGGVLQQSGATPNDFTKPVTYTVIAADNTTRDYTVQVAVASSTAKDLTSFAFLAAGNSGLSSDATGTIAGTNVSVTVPFGTNVTALVATFVTTGQSVAVGGTPQASGTTANDFTAPVTYTVSAADGSSKAYTVTVTIASSTAKDITAFSFLSAKNSGLAADVTGTIAGTNIALTVPNGTNVTALVATFTATGQSVTVGTTAQVSGTTANDFTNPVTYKVTAADASTKSYTVTVTVAASTAKDLTAFSFTSANNSQLSTDITGTITGTNIALSVPFGTNVTALVATFSTTGASVAVGSTTQVSGTTANDFTSPVAYKVTAADSSTKTYTVTVTIAASNAKDITAFSFSMAKNTQLTADVTGSISGSNIAATVPFGTDVTALVATFATTGTSVAVGSTAQVSGTTANDFTSPVVYTVTAADNSAQAYTVTVTVAPSPAKDITAFSFLKSCNSGLASDITGAITGTNIALTVPYGTSVTALVATFTTTGASVAVGTTTQVSGTTPNDFTSPVTYVVTAADSSQQSYTVTVTIAPAPKDITAFSFTATDNAGVLTADVTGVITGTNIALTVPYGTVVTGLIASFTTTGTGVTVGSAPQTTDVTANDFTSPLTYKVTGADSLTKDYTVTVTFAAAPKEITAFSFLATNNGPNLTSDVTGTITGYNIALSVPNGTVVTGLIATFTTSAGASVKVGMALQTTDVTPNDFTGPVTYTVIAADNTTQDYTVTVTILP